MLRGQSDEGNCMTGRNMLRKITTLSLFTALSLVMFIVESQLPPLFVPGAKLGLSNIFSLASLVFYGPIEAMVVVLARTILGSLVTGTVSALIYSLTAGLSAMLVASLLMLAYPKISLIAVSVTSAVVHNLTQGLIFALVSGSAQAWSYLPYLALIGLPSGALVGAVVFLLVKHLPRSVIYAALDGGKTIEKD